MSRQYLITGGAGFVGSNYARYALSQGHGVVLFDNLHRPGVERNIKKLTSAFPSDKLTVVHADLRDVEALKKAAAGVDVIAHLASQVAVTSAVENPREDFEINALGTFNVLDAARSFKTPPIVLYASTNKVYGALTTLELTESATRYSFRDHPYGVPEEHPLDFHSPYGCSKGTGDQYTRDFYRIYGVPTVVFRMSCIYGPQQYGMESQGWLSWMLARTMKDEAIRIYGDGKQVRDVLFISDLLAAYEAAIERIDVAKGQVYNIGGGADNSLSVWKEFAPIIAQLTEKEPLGEFHPWRPGDQRVYISDIRKAERELGWRPQVAPLDGLTEMYAWQKQTL